MSKITALAKRLPDDVDCAIISSDINRRYYTGLKSSAGYLIILKDKSYLLIDFRYYEVALSLVEDCEIVMLTSLATQLGEIFQKNNVKSCAVENQTMTIAQLQLFQNNFKDISFDFTDTLSSIISGMRIYKKDYEIERIIKAQRIAEKAFTEVLNFIKVGVSEVDIANFLEFFIKGSGAEAISFDTIALTGKNTSLPHGVPSDKKVESGDFVLMDFGAVFEGYHSDMTRTVCVGEPSDDMLLVYNTVINAQQAALDKAMEGVIGSDLDKAARDVIINGGYGEYFGHSLGHGVGLEIHELPNASHNSKTVLKENMVITIEPGIYIPEKFGVRVEDFVVICKNGYKNLTKAPKNLICI